MPLTIDSNTFSKPEFVFAYHIFLAYAQVSTISEDTEVSTCFNFRHSLRIICFQKTAFGNTQPLRLTKTNPTKHLGNKIITLALDPMR